MDGEDLVKARGSIEQWRITLGRTRALFPVGQVLVVVGESDLWEVEEGKICKSKRLEEEVSCAVLAHKQDRDFNILLCNFLMQMLLYSKDYCLLWAVKLDYVVISLFIPTEVPLKGAIIILTDQGSLEVTFAGTELQERTLKPIEGEVNMERVEK